MGSWCRHLSTMVNYTQSSKRTSKTASTRTSPATSNTKSNNSSILILLYIHYIQHRLLRRLSNYKTMEQLHNCLIQTTATHNRYLMSILILPWHHQHLLYLMCLSYTTCLTSYIQKNYEENVSPTSFVTSKSIIYPY